MLLTLPPLQILLFPLSWKIADIWLTGFRRKDLGIYTGRQTSALIFLAKIGLLLDNDFVVFSSSPVDLTSILEADANGLYVNRLCFEPLFVV